MIEKEFLLANSLRAFLIHEGDATCELNDDKPLIELVEEGELIEFDVYISLMKWEIHHGLKVDPESYIKFSIMEIVFKALNEPELSLDDYMDHFLNRLREISGAYDIYNTTSEEIEKNLNMESYLRNQN